MTNNRKKKVQTTEDAKVKGFLDMIALPVCLGAQGISDSNR